MAGDVNGVDFYLTSGNPAGSPSPGAISYATNSLTVTSGSTSFRSSMLDLATSCKVTGNSVTATPYTTLTRQYLSFTARSGLTASLYMIETGSVKLNFTSDLEKLTGTVNLNGRAAGYPSSPTVLYKATLTGTYLGTMEY